jgi:hypothetical protein
VVTTWQQNRHLVCGYSEPLLLPFSVRLNESKMSAVVEPPLLRGNAFRVSVKQLQGHGVVLESVYINK